MYVYLHGMSHFSPIIPGGQEHLPAPMHVPVSEHSSVLPAHIPGNCQISV